ncbi:MAG: hypothetical protein R3F59_19075 [Myxococcota bacterium]
MITDTTPLVGIFYFRAHRRSPGGNYDMYTLKVTLTATGERPTLRVASESNWDGAHYRRPEGPVALDPAPLLPRLRALAAQLQAAGAVDDAYTIHERRIDTDEYDTEWTTIELSLHDPPGEGERPEQGATLLRLEQTAVETKSYRADTPPHDPPDTVSQAFLDCVMRMCGVARVKDHAEGNDDLSRCSPPGSENLGYLDEPMPMYL